MPRNILERLEFFFNGFDNLCLNLLVVHFPPLIDFWSAWQLLRNFFDFSATRRATAAEFHERRWFVGRPSAVPAPARPLSGPRRPKPSRVWLQAEDLQISAPLKPPPLSNPVGSVRPPNKAPIKASPSPDRRQRQKSPALVTRVRPLQSDAQLPPPSNLAAWLRLRRVEPGQKFLVSASSAIRGRPPKWVSIPGPQWRLFHLMQLVGLRTPSLSVFL